VAGPRGQLDAALTWPTGLYEDGPGGRSFAEKVAVAGSPVDSAKLSRFRELGREPVTFIDLNNV